ncbi:hypothetical protein [Rhodococcus opacus]|uniref:hypothetical protein n=1 Tax=Rhodococcus opacus TaxID=37919 RepID=UPI00155ABD2A|nr:hypothetical protein [Rhodococcus opacus]
MSTPVRDAVNRLSPSTCLVPGVLVLAVLLPSLVGVTVTLAVLAGIAISVLCSRHPRIALTLWLLVVCFVPFWFGATDPFYLSPTALMSLLVLGAMLLFNRWEPNKIDVCILVFFACCAILVVVGWARPGDVTSALSQWLLSFLVGRLLVQRVGTEFTYRVVAVLFTVVAVCAVAEFVLRWNPYYDLTNATVQYRLWGHSQLRGGIIRSEWAFGHSIALANSVALVIPIVFATTFRTRVKVVCIALMLAAAVVSFSRSGMISAAFAVFLTLFFMKGRSDSRSGMLILAGSVVGAALASPWIVGIFEQAGSEAEDSAQYRSKLNGLIPTMNPMGIANGYVESDGVPYFSGFKSIDSTFVLLGLSFGLFIAAAAILGTVWLAVRVISRTATPPMIGVAAVVPALFTVALITQFGALLWFFIGMVSLTGARRPESELCRIRYDRQSQLTGAAA